MSLKSFTLFDELSLEGSLCKSVQGSWGFASLKLGISDCVVEVSLQGTIRLKEAELPRLMGLCTIRLREQVPKTHGALHP